MFFPQYWMRFFVAFRMWLRFAKRTLGDRFCATPKESVSQLAWNIWLWCPPTADNHHQISTVISNRTSQVSLHSDSVQPAGKKITTHQAMVAKFDAFSRFREEHGLILQKGWSEIIFFGTSHHNEPCQYFNPYSSKYRVIFFFLFFLNRLWSNRQNKLQVRAVAWIHNFFSFCFVPYSSIDVWICYTGLKKVISLRA